MSKSYRYAWMRAWGLASGITVGLLGAALLLSACGSDSSTQRAGETVVWRQAPDGSRRREVVASPADAPPPRRSDPDRTPTMVQIPPDVTQELSEFMRRKTTVIGNVVEVDVSRKPFLSASMFTSNPTEVSRVDDMDRSRGVLRMTLTNLTGVKTNLHALPRIELEGLQIIGVEKLVIRYWTKQTTERPLHLRAVATGNAAILIEEPGSRDRGSRVTLEAEVRKVAGRYRFDERRRVDP